MTAVNAYRELIAEVYELAGVSRQTSETLARQLGVTAAQWHVLSVISDEALPVPRIARRLGLVRQSVHRVIDDLAGASLVEVLPNPDHLRSPLIALTARGRAVLDRLWSVSDEDRSALLARSRVSEAELRRAARTLRALLDLFEDESATRSDSGVAAPAQRRAIPARH